MEGLHDATGSVSLWLLIIISVSGLAMFKYRYVKNYLNFPRQKFFMIHRYIIALLILTVVTHIFTTKNFNPSLFVGTGVLLPVIALGFMYRHKQIKLKYFNMLAYVKIAILVFSLIFLTVGHDIAEKNRHNVSSISE